MSYSTAEIASIPIKSGVDLTSGDSGKIWSDTLHTVASQPGCNEIYWGRQIERPDTVQLVVVWETYDHHKNFMSSPIFQPFVANLSSLLSGDLSLYHVRFPSSSPFSTPGSAPVSEYASLYFEPEYENSVFDANWSKFVDFASKTAEGVQGFAGGWAIEEQQHEKLGKDGEAGAAKLFALCIGWPTVEAHMKFRESEHFTEVVKYLRDGPKALELHHVEFQRFK